MSTKWTKDQQKVIDLRNRNLLVSAAAGSGKTAVLIERILGLITDETHPVDIDNLLVVTFTRAAAGEMRERLNSAIEKKLQTEEENEHLVRQLTLIQNAQITTIDSFCSYVLKNYFHVIGLDPNYRVMDEGEGKLLKGEVVQELLEEEYQKGEEDFLYFVECYATGKNDEILEESIFRLYEFAMSYPYPEKWLRECILVYQVKTMEEFLSFPWLTDFVQSLKKLLLDFLGLTKKALSIAREADGPYMYEAALLSDLQSLEGLLEAKDYEELWKALNEMKGWARLSAKKDEAVREEKKLLVKALREEVKKGVKGILEQYFAVSPKEEFFDMRTLGKSMGVLVNLTLAFMERFSAKKREKNLLDFHDMEHLTLSILLKEEEGEYVPTDTAKELASQFEEIMIDEYQDSNLVQEAILTAVSRKHLGKNNLFMVGDVKQSIYRFRLARPELFLEKYHTYTKEESENQRIDLSRNFRSRREILSFTNQIFREIMGEDLGKLVYDEAAALYPGAEYPKEEPGKLEPELLFLDLEESPELVEKAHETTAELEARMTGWKILSMVGKEEVYDRDLQAMRKMEFRDIVILFRSPAAFAEGYLKVLGDMGIPGYVGTRSGYFSAREIQVILALLKIIDNPRQDIPLASVMASPIGNFSSKEMALIKSGAGEGKSFHEASRWYADHGENLKIRGKLQKFYEMLGEFRLHAAYTPIHELLWFIFDYTGYEDYVSAMPSGEQRALNLKMLVQKAWDYEKTSYRGLFNFIRYIENLQKYDVDYGEAGLLGEEKNVVRIMSIHKSKGLEFPVVILGGLEKQFNQQDTRNRLVLDVDLGAGCDLVDPELRVRRPTLFKRCVQKKVKDDNMGEELRVLYVALTRAKERLILTGLLKDLSKKAEEWYRNTEPEKQGLSYGQLTEASGYLDFIMPVLLKYESAGEFLEKMGLSSRGFRKEADPVWNTTFRIRVLDIQDLLVGEMGRQVKDESSFAAMQRFDTETVYDEEFHEILKERMEGAYPFGDSRGIPVKLTVSQLKKQSQRIEADEEALLFPDDRTAWDSGEGWEEMPEPGQEKNGEKKGIAAIEDGPEELVPEFMKEETPVEGASRGTAYHVFLQHLDFCCDGSRESLTEQLKRLELKGMLTPGEAKAIDIWKIQRLLASELGKRLRKAAKRGELYREQHFVYAIPSKELYPESSLEKELLIQGVIDAYFEEDGDLILVDYKTDFVKKGEERGLYEKYASQLQYYARALTQLTGKEVREKLIYSLYLQKTLSGN